VRMKRLWIEKSNYLIENWTLGLPTCSKVSQPTTLLHTTSFNKCRTETPFLRILLWEDVWDDVTRKWQFIAANCFRL
jgi:hypothetical protein